MRYKAKLLRKEGTGYTKVGEMKFKITDTTLQINKDKTVPIKLEFSHKEGNILYIYIDMDSEEQIKFEKWSSGYDGEDIDAIVTKKLLTSLLTKIKQGTELTDKSHALIYIIILLAGVAIGVLIGILIYQYVVPSPVVVSQIPNNPVV